MFALRIFALFSLAAAAFAQTDTGTISGAITDPAGAVVVGAKMEARNQSTGLSFSGISNESGNYVISALPPDRYEVTIAARGFVEGDPS